MSDHSFTSDTKSRLPKATPIESTKFDEADVFANALDLVDVHARSRYLDQVAGANSVQRQRLERLLNYSVSNTEFLETEAHETATIDGSRVETVGDWLGPYRLLEQIGEGGMGTVFMAEQVSPLQRRVAIKVIKPGMDSSQVLARFEAERQVLAMMEHPNIARAIDVGVSAQGRTYFVMELVRGVPITRYCDDLRLSIRERLELFIPVCQAIQHAHQKGIIHRDLKPSNILVAEYDGVAVPKVIDFGVAKALHQQLTCTTLFTQFGQIIGTMEYMSPEQSRVNQLDIDTRSDIYSLGVLLYELTTGTTPIQSGDLKELSWDELVRLIREEDAPAPSQRLSAIERLELIARQRSTETTELPSLVKGELDWIVLKALNKQRSRRYQNATELADDVRRFLSGSAVLACPPSTAYRLRKYFQKHKFAFLAGGLVTIAIALGFAGTAWQAWQASTARKHAEHQLDIASAEALLAQAAQTKAQLEMAKAAQEAEITRAVASFVNNDLISFADPNLEPDRNIRLREIVDRASEKVASLQAVPLVEASIRYTLAKSYLGLGEYRTALDHAEASWKIRIQNLSQFHPDSLSSLLLVGNAELKLSRFQDACNTFERAVKISCDASLTNASIKLDGQHGYGIALARLNKLEAAMATLKEVAESRRSTLGASHLQTLETEREMAELLFQKGEYQEAYKSFETLTATMTKLLGESHPLTLKTIASAANVASELGDIAEAVRKRESILERQTRILGENHPDTLITASNLTLVKQRNIEPAAAINKNVELMQIAEEKLGKSNMIVVSIALALSEILTEHGRAAEATKYLEQCQATLQELNQSASPDLLRVRFRIAGCLAFEGKYQQALSLYRQTLSDQQSLLSDKHLDTLKTKFSYAFTLMSSGDYQTAEEHLLSLIKTANESDLKNHPLIQYAESKLATLESVLGRTTCLERHQAARDEAQRKYGSSSAIGLQLDIACAESLLRFGRVADAKQLLEKGLTTVDAHYVGTHPIRGQLKDALVEALAGGGEYAEAIKLAKTLYLERQVTFGNQHPLTMRSQNQLGALLVKSGAPLQGVVLIRQAMEGSQQCFGKEFPMTLTYQQNLASTLGVISVSDRSKRQETLRLFEELLAIQSAWGIDHPDWLFSQLGYAGALGQQGRFLQAERVFETLLPKLVKVYGESHPFTLRCRENYSSVLGSLGKYPQAIEQCRACLAASPAGSISARKVTHAAIEYYINSGNVLAALELYDSAYQMATHPKVDLDWLFLDVPFFVDALAQSGEYDKAKSLIDNAVALFTEKLGRKHPKTLYLASKKLSLVDRYGKPEDAQGLLESLMSDLQIPGERPSKSIADAIASLAKKWVPPQGLHVASLYGMAAQADQRQKANAEDKRNSNDASEASPQPEAPKVDYPALAIHALGACAERGQLQSPRSQHWLMHSSDLTCLRDREDFKKILAEVNESTIIEKVIRLSWNWAIVGEHQQAADMLRSFEMEHSDLAELALVNYLMARNWARCYEVAVRQGLTNLASEYLDRCQSSLQICQEKGYLQISENSTQLASDDNFAIVREKIVNFEKYIGKKEEE